MYAISLSSLLNCVTLIMQIWASFYSMSIVLFDVVLFIEHLEQLFLFDTLIMQIWTSLYSMSILLFDVVIFY